MTAGAALLPEGFRDRLPPMAEASARLTRIIVDCFGSHGYDRVQPPLVEYESGLIRWLGGAQVKALFRSSDPASGAGLALRPDITGQIARIAATRLADAPRPLRLAYAGPVLRARAGQLDPARELTQAGAELIGSDSVGAVAEIINAALEALRQAGVTNLSVDLTTPELVPMLAKGPWPVQDSAALIAALDGKDRGALAALGAERYGALLDAAGPADMALERISLVSPQLGAQLTELAGRLTDVRITIDPTERHGFEYQSWVGFSLFGEANGRPLRSEIGRGGAYRVAHPSGDSEVAAGVSLYVESLVDAGLGTVPRRRLFLPPGAPAETGAAFRAKGWATIAALSANEQPNGCTHVLVDGQAVPRD